MDQKQNRTGMEGNHPKRSTATGIGKYVMQITQMPDDTRLVLDGTSQKDESLHISVLHNYQQYRYEITVSKHNKSRTGYVFAARPPTFGIEQRDLDAIMAHAESLAEDLLEDLKE
jgi:hypothetical protein